MKKNKIIKIGGIATAILLLLSASSKTYNLANGLYNQWKGTKENESSFYNTLLSFWLNLDYDLEKAKRYVTSNVAWSAAFISYVMTKGGYSNFPKSASHTCFASKIKTGKYKDFQLKRIGDYSPKVGDLVIKNRSGGKLTFDSFKCGDYSHSDIVTQVLPYKIITIGGNVGNSIAKTTVKTSKNGRITDSNYFAIIKVI